MSQLYNHSPLLQAAIKCKPYSEMASQWDYGGNWDAFKNCKNYIEYICSVIYILCWWGTEKASVAYVIVALLKGNRALRVDVVLVELWFSHVSLILFDYLSFHVRIKLCLICILIPHLSEAAANDALLNSWNWKKVQIFFEIFKNSVKNMRSIILTVILFYIHFTFCIVANKHFKNLM